jgi:hypothetical protein
MQIKKEVTVKKEEIVDYICNKCGKSCKLHCGNDGGLTHGFVNGSYDSEHLEDLTNYYFSLCEKCISELFSTFKIPVEKEEEIF